jgi:hypothetical protein
MLLLAAACIVGAAAGAAFASLWLRAVPRGTNRRFWSAAFVLSGELLKADELAGLLRLYRRLAELLGGYLARNLFGTVLAGLPLVLVVLAAAPLAPDARTETAFLAAFALATLAGLLWPKRS